MSYPVLGPLNYDTSTRPSDWHSDGQPVGNTPMTDSIPPTELENAWTIPSLLTDSALSQIISSMMMHKIDILEKHPAGYVILSKVKTSGLCEIMAFRMNADRCVVESYVALSLVGME